MNSNPVTLHTRFFTRLVFTEIILVSSRPAPHKHTHLTERTDYTHSMAEALVIQHAQVAADDLVLQVASRGDINAVTFRRHNDHSTLVVHQWTCKSNENSIDREEAIKQAIDLR